MGTVDVVSEDSEIVYDTLKEGDFFGEMTCLCGAPSIAFFRYITVCVFRQWYLKNAVCRVFMLTWLSWVV